MFLHCIGVCKILDGRVITWGNLIGNLRSGWQWRPHHAWKQISNCASNLNHTAPHSVVNIFLFFSHLLLLFQSFDYSIGTPAAAASILWLLSQGRFGTFLSFCTHFSSAQQLKLDYNGINQMPLISMDEWDKNSNRSNLINLWIVWE